MTPKRNLRLVSESTEAMLRRELQYREELRRDLGGLDASIADLLRQLARERGVAFIRVETARQELLG